MVWFDFFFLVLWIWSH